MTKDSKFGNTYLSSEQFWQKKLKKKLKKSENFEKKMKKIEKIWKKK